MNDSNFYLAIGLLILSGCDSRSQEFLEFADRESNSPALVKQVVVGYTEDPDRRLQRIWIRGPIDRKYLEGALLCESTEDLSIAKQCLSEDDCKAISRIKRLRNLAVIDCEVKASSVLLLLQNPHLSEVQVLDSQFTSPDLQNTGVLSLSSNLRKINIKCSLGLSSSELQQVVSGCPNLSSLRISRSTATASSLLQISNLVDLRYLDVSYTQVNEDCFSRWGNLKHLESIEVRGVTLCERSLWPILDMDKIRRVDLRLSQGLTSQLLKVLQDRGVEVVCGASDVSDNAIQCD